MHWRTKRKIEARRERARRAAEVRWARDRARRDEMAGSAPVAPLQERGGRWFVGLRDNRDGEEAWIPFRSWADLRRRLEMVMRNLS